MRQITGMLAGLAITVIAEPALAASYAASKVRFENIIGDVNIVTTAGEEITVNVRQGKSYHSVAVRLVDDELMITGEPSPWDDAGGCCGDRILREGSLQRDRASPPDQDAFFADYPVIEISMPRKGDIAFENARIKLSLGGLDGRLALDGCYVYGETAELGQASIGLISGSRLAIGDVKAKLELDLSGKAVVVAGSAAMADIDIAGAGEVMMGGVDGMLDVSIAGSGLARIARIDGPMVARIAGSGTVAVQGGRADKLTVTIDGSGGVYFGGIAVSPTLRLNGSPKVRLGSVEGRVTRRGRGAVDIGGEPLSDR
jgi:hypothetical protein